MERTLPASAQRPFLSGPYKAGAVQEYRWEFHIEIQWPEYANWVTAQLDYECHQGVGAVDCVRSLEGDSFTLRLLRPDADSKRKDVRAVFGARPY